MAEREGFNDSAFESQLDVEQNFEFNGSESNRSGDSLPSQLIDRQMLEDSGMTEEEIEEFEKMMNSLENSN